MELDIVTHTPALIGVIFDSKVIFNVLEEDTEFLNSGLSIINHIKNDKNRFVAKIIESQSYDSIRVIYDDKFVFGDFYDLNNENREDFVSIMNLIRENADYKYFYFLELETSTLIVKIPEINIMYALDYNNSEDVRKLINLII
jgi:hypothetical protein